jgi:hypothetical protein
MARQWLKVDKSGRGRKIRAQMTVGRIDKVEYLFYYVTTLSRMHLVAQADLTKEFTTL